MPNPNTHRLDLSNINNPNMVTEEAQAVLEEMIRTQSLKENELTFLTLSAKKTPGGNLETTFILTNGTADDLTIRQIPLNLYDATGALVAQGTFQLNDVSFQANTSKPLTLRFPEQGILQDEMDLSSAKIELAAEF